MEGYSVFVAGYDVSGEVEYTASIEQAKAEAERITKKGLWYSYEEEGETIEVYIPPRSITSIFIEQMVED